MKIEFQLLTMDETHMIEYENMRLKAFGYENYNRSTLSETRYALEAQTRKFIAIGLYYETELDAIAYVSNNHSSLYIEQLFVRKDKQGQHLHLGKTLLQYILDHKETFETYFNQAFDVSSITPVDSRSIAIYESMGYKKEKGIYGIYNKKI